MLNYFELRIIVLSFLLSSIIWHGFSLRFTTNIIPYIYKYISIYFSRMEEMTFIAGFATEKEKYCVASYVHEFFMLDV